MKTSQKITCDGCGSDCRVTYQKTDSMVLPSYCPFCGDSVDDGEDREWPESEDDE